MRNHFKKENILDTGEIYACDCHLLITLKTTRHKNKIFYPYFIPFLIFKLRYSKTSTNQKFHPMIVNEISSSLTDKLKSFVPFRSGLTDDKTLRNFFLIPKSINTDFSHAGILFKSSAVSTEINDGSVVRVSICFREYFFCYSFFNG